MRWRRQASTSCSNAAWSTLRAFAVRAHLATRRTNSPIRCCTTPSRGGEGAWILVLVCRPGWASTSGKRAAGEEDVLAAVVGERLTGEPAIQGFQFETSDVEQPEPLVL